MPAHRAARPPRVRRQRLATAVLTLALALATTSAVVATAASTPRAASAAAAPIRAAFYYPWFPETEHWATHYSPSLGQYDSSDPAVIDAHIAAAQYAGLDAFIASWWGQGSHTDQRLPLLLSAAKSHGFAIAPYYEPEGKATAPTAAQLSSDLQYLYTRAQASPGWLRVAGKPVLFVYNAQSTDCSETSRWASANAGRFYLNLKVFQGYASCASQPDAWHQYGPASGYDQQGASSASVSPGFWKFNESSPRLVRNLSRFSSDLARQVASGTQWQLLTTFNEWGEGTAVESASQWSTSSGHGAYLDAMRAAYGAPSGSTSSPPASSSSSSSASSSSSSSAPPTSSSSAPTTSSTVDGTLLSDADVESDNPTLNSGSSTTIGTDGSPLRDGYYHFQVDVPAGATVVSAQFSCYAISANAVGMTVSSAADNWTESGVTWADRPAPQTQLGTSGPVSRGSYSSAIDVTQAINGSGTYTFVTSTSSPTRWSCASKERNGSHPAHLTVEVSTASSPSTSSSAPPSTSSSAAPSTSSSAAPSTSTSSSAPPSTSSSAPPSTSSSAPPSTSSSAPPSTS
ncbi:MAG: DUF7594 domain-containing protein, partial [Jatrophihabitantaceae bacterium]